MKRSVFLAIALFLSAPALAESDMDVALEIVSLSRAGTDAEKLAKTLQVAFGVETEAQAQAVAEEVLRIMNSEPYRNDIAAIYVEMLTSAELREFRNLMKSPVWQKWLENKHSWAQQVSATLNEHIIANQNQFLTAIENAK